MDEVNAIIGKLVNGELTSEAAAHELLPLADVVKGSKDKTLVAILQAAKEVVHYKEQALAAPTTQWQASFLFEKQQSEKTLVKGAKTFQKKAV